MSKDIIIPGVNGPGLPQEPPILNVAQPMNDTQLACVLAAALLQHPDVSWRDPQVVIDAVRAAHLIIETAVTLEPERVKGVRRGKERVALGQEGN